MWKETLLQGLIALLPVFLFLVWYDRPERTRFVPYFLGFACGAAMLLNMRYSVLVEHVFSMDFRYVPVLIGSLYGGIPVAVLLCAICAAIRIASFTKQWPWDYVLLLAFVLCFCLPLIRCSASFFRRPRSGRFKTALALFAVLFLFFCAVFEFAEWREPGRPLWAAVASLLFYWSIFLFTLIVSLNFTELGFERVNLQMELRDMSHKYRGEVRRLQQFIDQAPLLVLFFDISGKVTHINESSLRAFHPLSRRQLLNMHYRDLSRASSFEISDYIERAMRGEDPICGMVAFRGKTYFTVACAVKGMHGQALEGTLVIGHDVTEVQQLKDEVGRMERLSLVGQMAASITHEIRNPMAVIRGFVQLLGERSSSEQQSYFRIVMEELDRANGIINDFLSLAQNRILEMEPGNLHDVLSELMPLIWADANMRGQIVELRLCEEMEPLEINSKEIKQLVLNLARNGMEAMSDKGVLRIETVNLADTVQLRVTDHGTGIPKDKLERLFEPFYTTKSHGTGLGLSLCLSIVERHNGKIHVESKVGEGTTFIVSFCKPGRHCW